MRLRDLFIFCVGLLAVALTLLQEHAVTFRPGFTLTNADSYDSNALVPSPVVVDLNHDGKSEVVLVQGGDVISVLPSYSVRRSYDGVFVEVQPVASTPLTTDCIGLGVGRIRDNDTDIKGSTHIIVALSNDYVLNAYSSTLSEMWSVILPVLNTERNKDTGERFVPHHASILVLPNAVYAGDRGVIVVGVPTMPGKGDEDGASGVHYSYYGVNSADGVLRWKHDESNFVNTLAEESKGVPQTSYKLTARDLEHHATEIDWRTFRHSMMMALPHRHDHPWDTYMTPFAFTRKKNRKKRAAQYVSQEDTSRPKYQTRSRARVEDKGELGARLKGAMIAGNKQQQAVQQQAPPPNVVVVHTKIGIEVVHLFTGRTLCQVGPLVPHVTYDDFNSDMVIDVAFPSIMKEQIQHRNGLVDEKSTCDGVVSSNVPFTHELLFRTSICKSGPVIHADLITNFLRGEESFESSEGLSVQGAASSDNFEVEDTVATAPASVHRTHRDGVGLSRVVHDVVFHLSSGLLTCVDTVRKTVRWRTQTKAWFHGKKKQQRSEDGHDTTAPQLHPYPHTLTYNPLVSGKVDDPYVLAIGLEHLAIVHSGTGHVEEHLGLAAAPIAPVIVADFNADGINDLLMLTEEGYRGYLGVQRRGNAVMPYLLLSILSLIVLLVVSQKISSIQDPWAWQYATGGKRSTD
eukprot:PhM_4_TR9510/c1_g3_i1/m.98232